MLKFSIDSSGRVKASRRFGPVLLGATATLLAACGGANLTYPCASKTQEEPFEIRRMFDSATGASANTAVLTEFSIDGHARNAPWLAGPFSSGVEVISRDSLRCGPPCKFGGEAGLYRFLVSTPGYEPRRVEVFADWTEKIPAKASTGCDYILKGQTVIEIGLQRAQ